MTVTVGSSSDKCRIGDNGTASQGTYEIFLNPTAIPESWDMGLVDGSEVVADGDNSIGAQAGKIMIAHVLRGCHLANAYATWDNVKLALQDWSKDNTLLYYTEKNSESTPHNMARWPDFGTQSISVDYLRVRVLKIEITEKTSDYWFFNVYLRRFTV